MFMFLLNFKNFFFIDKEYLIFFPHLSNRSCMMINIVTERNSYISAPPLYTYISIIYMSNQQNLAHDQEIVELEWIYFLLIFSYLSLFYSQFLVLPF